MAKKKPVQLALFHVKDVDRKTKEVAYTDVVVEPLGSSRRQILRKNPCDDRSTLITTIKFITADAVLVKTFQAITHLDGLSGRFDDLLETLLNQEAWPEIH